MRATAITDASYCQRPNRQCAGWAAWVKGDNGLAVKGYGVVKAHDGMTSTTAELYAALNGLWLAANGGATNVLIRSDCLTVQQAVNGTLRKQYLIDLWGNAIQSARLEHVVVSAKHVKGHGPVHDRATWVNDWCDNKAKFAMSQARRGKQCLKIS